MRDDNYEMFYFTIYFTVFYGYFSNFENLSAGKGHIFHQHYVLADENNACPVMMLSLFSKEAQL